MLDDGAVAARVRALYPSGVDGAIELVGTPTLPDTLASVRVLQSTLDRLAAGTLSLGEVLGKLVVVV